MKSQVIENVSPLTANAVFITGIRDWEGVSDDYGVTVSHYIVEVDSDQAGSIEVDQSTDMIVWAAVSAASAYTAASGILHVSVQPTLRYVRSRYTNGTTLQTRFTMSTGVDYT